MKEIYLVAAADRQWGIGYQNELLFHMKKDMEFFRKKTLGNVVIMGRKTFESLPDARPLPDRKNIVLTRDGHWKQRYDKLNDSLFVLTSVEEVLETVRDERREVYVIGGQQIYQQFLPFAAGVYLTKVDAVRTADCYFPNLDRLPDWRKADVSETIWDESGVSFTIVQYEHYKRMLSLRQRTPQPISGLG